MAAGETIAPEGQSKTFTFNVVAPRVPGTYNFQWQMVQDGVAWFGDKTPNVAVTVSAPCVPKTCAGLGNYVCGSYSDGCGGTLNCGSCAAGQNCTNGVCVAACVPKTCSGLGYGCGSVSDGCGNTLNCGVCSANETCANNKCVANCVPKTCAALGDYECGSWSNGCSATVSCGACGAGKTCSNGKCVADCAVHSSKKCDSGKLYWYNSCGVKEDLFQDCGTDILTDNYRCGGNWTQRETTVAGCSNDVCTSVSAWNNSADCAASGKVCSNGICAAACTNECTINGAKQCMENGYQICRDDNGDGCLEWSEVIACAGGKTCVEGICSISSCVAKTCGSLGYECGSVSDGCGKTLNCGGCGSGNVCSSGVCVAGSSSSSSVASQSTSKTLTRTEIVAKVGEIMALIAKLQEQLKAMTGATGGAVKYSCGQITKNLYYGMKNDPEVKCLQEVLKAQGFAVVPTGDYGGITKAAVKQFQEKYASEILTPYGLKYGAGNVGNGTMAKMNALIGAN